MHYRIRKMEAFAYDVAARFRQRLGHGSAGFRSMEDLPASRPIDVLVVCQGNVCRSPYAEVKLREALGDPEERRVHVHSAGLLTTPGKPAHPTGCEVAHGRGVDLTQHRTRDASDLLFAAHLLLIMDPSHRRRIAAVDRSLLRKTMYFCAPAVEAGVPLVVPDPYGLPTEVFEACFDQLDRAAAILARSLLVQLDGS